MDSVYKKYLINSLTPECIFFDNELNILHINGNIEYYLNSKAETPLNLESIFSQQIITIIRNYIESQSKNSIGDCKTKIFDYNNSLIHLSKTNLIDLTTFLLTFYKLDLGNNTNSISPKYSFDTTELYEKPQISTNNHIFNLIEDLLHQNKNFESRITNLTAQLKSAQTLNQNANSLNNDLYNLLNYTEIAIIFLDKNLNIRLFSESIKKHFLIDKTDIGTPFLKISQKFPNRSKKDFNKIIKKVISSHKPIELEVVFPGRKTYLKRIIPYWTFENTLDGVIISYVDISKTKDLQNDLQLILDHLPGLVFYKDGKNNLIKVNEMLAKEHNTTKNRLEGKSCFDLYQKELAQAYLKDDLEIIKSGKSKLNIIEPWVTPQGRKWINTNKILIKDNNVHKILGVSIDITELIQIEEDLRSSEKRLMDIAKSTSDWFWEVDKTGVYTYCSSGVKNVLGYYPNEVLGKSPLEFMPKDEANRIGEIFKGHLLSKKPIKNLINYNLTKDGTLICLLTNGVPILDNKNNLIGFRGADKDITSQINAEDELKKTLKQLESSNNELSQFAYIASHDLQEPINTIIGFLTLLNETKMNLQSNEADKIIKTVIDSSFRMKELIQAILNHSLLGESNDLESFSLTKLFSNLFQDISSLIKQRNAIVTLNSIPEKIIGYKANIYLLFKNLITNAIKFNKSSTPTIKISCVETEGYYHFLVKDNGIGIDNKNQDKIFNIFHRLHPRKEYDGVGIGLANCRKIVEMHNGKIWVESKEGLGSNFNFTIEIL